MSGRHRPGDRPGASAAMALLLAATLLAAACAENGSSIVDEMFDGGKPPKIQPTLASLQKNVFGRICINCHFPGGPGPMPLDSEQASFDNLVNAPSVEIPGVFRVVPGDPASSYLVAKIQGLPGIVGDPMPPPPERRLTPQEIQAIIGWIANGAPR